MPVLGLTGGVAVGKSTFAQKFLALCPAEFFDSDACVHQLLAEDDKVRDAIIADFGSEVCGPNGRPDRKLLREKVFANSDARHQLESILHPRVRERWMEAAQQARETGTWAILDIPLLYETNVAQYFDSVMVVACTQDTQMRRMREQRGLDDRIAAQMINAQLDLRKKIQQADYLIWNDSTVSNLDGQARILAACLKQRFA